VAAAPVDKKADRKAQAQLRQQAADRSRPLRKEVATIEQRMTGLTHEAGTIETQMVRPDLPALRMAELGKRLKQIGDENERLEARWLELNSQIDALGNAGA
jgi:ATP-binding cassette subfamily F protein 3